MKVTSFSKIENNKKSEPTNTNVAAQIYSAAQSYEMPFNSSKKYLVNFKGLNRTLSKTAYETVISIKREVGNFPKSQGVVGTLPKEWIDKIPKNDRELKIKELYQDFKSIVKDFRATEKTLVATDNLNNALQKAGVIEKSEKLTLGECKEGCFGWAFQMQGISSDNFIIKIFKSNDSLSNSHGNYAELNRAACWQKNVGKNTQMARFYFGDSDAGYMVNKFIDSNKTPVCKKYVAPEAHGLLSSDADNPDVVNGRNIINGFQIDYGGLLVLDNAFIRKHKLPLELKNIFDAPVENRLLLIRSAKKETKQMLACQLNSLPEDERTVAFGLLAEGSDDRMKRVLAHKLFSLPENSRGDAFKILAESSDNKVRTLLAYRLGCLSGNDSVVYFKHFLKTSDDNMKINLLANLYALPLNERGQCFNELALTANNEVKKGLVDALPFLADEERVVCFNKMADSADNEIKTKLIGQLPCLPEADRLDGFNRFADSSDTDLKIKLINNFSCLRDEDKGFVFNQLTETADNVEKKELIRNFAFLPHQQKASCFKKLAERSDDDIKKAMQALLYKLTKAERQELSPLVKVEGEAIFENGLSAFNLRFGRMC